MTENLGELAALGTAACWAGSALSFEAAGRRIGSLAVNLLRLPVAICALAALSWVTRGLALPTDASIHAWLWLSLSGLIGFVFGDLCLFRALVVIGPRLSSLIMSTAPVFTALFGWVFLGEVLTSGDWLAMGMVVVGIGWAVGEKKAPLSREGGRWEKPTVWGIALATAGALGQAGGLVVAKHGMGSYDPFAATQIRVFAGFLGFSMLFTVFRQWPRVAAARHHKRALGQVTLGALFGPFLGVGLSLLAVQNTQAGVAAAIMATTPILLIPLVVVLYRERVGVGGMFGAILAVAGVALLFHS